MNQNNTIAWSKDYFLQLSDFKADSNPAAFEDSHSTIKYSYIWTVNSEGFGDEIKFFIENIVLTTEFYPMLSWIRQSQETTLLLKHEQGHFDLAELLKPKITRHLEDAFLWKKFSTRGQNQEQQKQHARENSGLMIANEIEKWEKYLFDEHQEYDAQTNYGQILEKQQKFDDMFKKLRM
ncbi:hypothetical protein [Nitrosarchaeum sp. AC2]|uniref:hypothetical protein n=1 Tax=Nitrosarchaeum sp. AC2 TaxID=2259673 RepID=UPI0015C84B4C|nr:hypothetical protein [Nitrosarchaeum sp. AC2]QLH10760.1 hypothetical protein DSQ20_04210 [Nitrosarchaeum sp. AC2]